MTTTYTVNDLKNYIDKYIRATSKKTGRKIKVNTYGLSKSELEDIIKSIKGSWKNFMSLHGGKPVKAKKIAGKYHSCPYCGGRAVGPKKMLCSECQELFGHSTIDEL